MAALWANFAGAQHLAMSAKSPRRSKAMERFGNCNGAFFAMVFKRKGKAGHRAGGPPLRSNPWGGALTNLRSVRSRQQSPIDQNHFVAGDPRRCQSILGMNIR